MPLIMAATMFWQQKITPTDPRQKSIGYMMPIMMTFFFYTMSSGLVFYWTVSNLMTVLQQIWMYRKMPKPAAAPREEPEARRSKGKSKRR
jgi:YidC/Oxa1 family membrane protein insertase